MPSTAIPAEDVIAACSFCGKPSTTVAKLVAGPGVYICNECVVLSAAVVEDATGTSSAEASRPGSHVGDRPTEEILAMLPALVVTADRIEAELAGWIHHLRERGTEWTTIAAAATLSVDAARRRFESVHPA